MKIHDLMAEAGFEIDPTIEMNVVRNARILSDVELSQFVEIQQMLKELMQAKTIIHDDVALCTGKCKELFFQLGSRA